MPKFNQRTYKFRQSFHLWTSVWITKVFKNRCGFSLKWKTKCTMIFISPDSVSNNGFIALGKIINDQSIQMKFSYFIRSKYVMIFSKRKNVRCLSYFIDLDLSSYCFGWFRTILTEVLDFIHAVFQIKDEKIPKKKHI